MNNKIRSLGEYMERVDCLREGFNVKDHEEIWFRGENLKYKKAKSLTFLRPTLYRPRVDRRRVAEILRSVDILLDIESELADKFRHYALQLTQERAEDDNWDWDSYFLMQHHAVPTRLLDWSDGALTALHFAVYSEPDDEKNDAVVYVMDPDDMKHRPDSTCVTREWSKFVNSHMTEGYSESNWECAYLPATQKDRLEMRMPFVPDDPLVLEFPHITRRVAAQRSRFVLFGKCSTWLSDKLGNDDFHLREITVDARSRKNIKRQLRDCGITESVIYPDLDGSGRELKQLWKIWT